jgi:hypothetical protein
LGVASAGEGPWGSAWRARKGDATCDDAACDDAACDDAACDDAASGEVAPGGCAAPCHEVLPIIISGLSIHEVFTEVDELEGGRDVEQRLGVAEEEEAAGEEALVEHLDHAATRGVVEVDEHVAAKDHVDSTDDGRRSRIRRG